MDKDLKHDIILIVVSFSITIIAFCVIFIPHNKNNFKENTNNNKVESKKVNATIKDGTYTCVKDEKDESTETHSEATITYKNNYIKQLKQVDTQTGDAEQLKINYSFSQLFLTTFNSIDGLKVEMKQDGDDKLITTYFIDYEKFDYEKFKKDILNGTDTENNSNASFSVTKDTKIEDALKIAFSDYSCKIAK